MGVDINLRPGIKIRSPAGAFQHFKIKQILRRSMTLRGAIDERQTASTKSVP